MNNYLSDLSITPLFDGERWELLEDFHVNLPFIGKQTIPEGFIFDFASIPKAFQAFFAPATGKYRYPALVHDYLYSAGLCSRKVADEIFLILMRKAGVSYCKRYTIYYAVRAFGSFSFKGYGQ